MRRDEAGETILWLPELWSCPGGDSTGWPCSDRLRRLHYLLAAWTLVLGYAGALIYIAAWQRLPPVLCLLALPAGLAALLVSPAGGVLAAAGISLILLPIRPPFLPSDRTLLLTATIGAWGTVGLVWMTSYPLLTTVEWSWSSYQRSRSLLERTRDYQVQLKQTLADLAEANIQLTRLNRLAQALRQSAEEARQAKEEFVANVSHELRTPLNMIIGFSEMIVRAPQTYGAGIPPTLLADLAVILRNSQHLSSLIDDVLDLSRVEAGRVGLTKERVGLHEVVEGAMTAVRPLFESKGLSLQAAVATDLPAALCDRTRIRAVLLNLLSNAGRFTEQGGVTVRAWQEEDSIVVSVADSGPGISAEDKERIFQTKWCAFLGEHGFLVDLNLDSPGELHDRYRRDKGGRPTFEFLRDETGSAFALLVPIVERGGRHDDAAKKIDCPMEWRDLPTFEDLLVRRLTG